MPESDLDLRCRDCRDWPACYRAARCLSVAPQRKPCCGAVGKGKHEPGCPKRVAELAASGAFDD